jgi:hypothetical protein
MSDLRQIIKDDFAKAFQSDSLAVIGINIYGEQLNSTRQPAAILFPLTTVQTQSPLA